MNQFIQSLKLEGIESRPLYPDIDTATYFALQNQDFPNSRQYGFKGLCLPSGPSQDIPDIKKPKTRKGEILLNNSTRLNI